MLRNRPQRVFWAVVLGDLLALAFAFFIAWLIRPEAARFLLLVGLPTSRSRGERRYDYGRLLAGVSEKC